MKDGTYKTYYQTYNHSNKKKLKDKELETFRDEFNSMKLDYSAKSIYDYYIKQHSKISYSKFYNYFYPRKPTEIIL